MQLPTARSTFLTTEGLASYQEQRARIGGHSDTYEVARLVVRNRIMSQTERKSYFLRIMFPSEFSLTNAVITPNHSPFGEIDPQITPVEVSIAVSSSRTIKGLEVDMSFAVTIVEAEPRRAVAGTTENPHAQQLDDAVNGMFGA